MGAGRRTVRAILAAAARGEEESLQHHADTPVRLPIALWIPPARLFYETAMENIRVHVRRPRLRRDSIANRSCQGIS